MHLNFKVEEGSTYVALFLVVAEFAVDATVAAQRHVHTDGIFAVELRRSAFPRR